MNEIFGSVFWLIVSLGILVTFHEFGHFWMARRFGVKVLRFSIGFGRPLWTRVGRDGTEYVIAAIPLGGYVKMLDERDGDAALSAKDMEGAHNRKPVGQRFAIAAAGPIANLLLAVLLLWAMFIIGKSDYAPVVGRSEGIAATAGVEAGDRLLAIDGEAMPTWTHAMQALIPAALDRRPVALRLVAGNGGERALTLDMSRLGANFDEARAMRAIGLIPRHVLVEPVIGEFEKGSPAQAAGLAAGDRIVRVGEQPIAWYDEIGDALQPYAADGRPVSITIERRGERLVHVVQPRLTTDETSGKSRWVIDIKASPSRYEYDALLRYGPLDAAGAALSETWRLTESTFGMIWRMISGVASSKNISSAISIAQYANASAGLGVAWFLFFLAILSLSLCIMNLLPIPVLDGGHLLYYLVEMVKGSPVSERVQMAGQYAGLLLLAGLMGLAFYNDIVRLAS